MLGIGKVHTLVSEAESVRETTENAGFGEVAGALTSVALGFALSFALILKLLPVAVGAGVLSSLARWMWPGAPNAREA